MNFDKAIWLLSISTFFEKIGRLSSAGPEILAFVRYCLANVQPILNCFIPNFELKYEDSENIKTDRVNTVVFNLNQFKERNFFGTHGRQYSTVVY